ncbi:MAG: hypothetical protein WCC70_11975 [Candidatus Aquilonibacter sp.]
MKGNAAFMKHVTRPFIFPCTTCSGSAPGSDFNISYDGISLGGVGIASFDGLPANYAGYWTLSDDSDQYDDWLFALNDGSGYEYGPTYTTPSPSPPPSCATQALESVGSALTAIATWIQANPAAAAAQLGASYKNVAFFAGGVVAGEITLAEFCGVLFAALTAPEIVALLAVVGATVVTVALIWQWYKCVKGLT